MAKGIPRVGEPTATFDTYIERLVKLVPTEVVSAYLVGRELAVTKDASTEWAFACLLFTLVVRSAMTFERREGRSFWDGIQWGAVVISAVSFSIWMYSLGDHLPYLGWIPSWSASLALLLWTPMVPYIYRGDPAGADAPGPVVHVPSASTANQEPTVQSGYPSPEDSNPVPVVPEHRKPKDILGDDDRTAIAETKVPPYAPIALLHAFIGGEAGAQTLGTGWFIGPRTVVTAAHVVCGAAFPPNGVAGRVMGWPGYHRDARENVAFTTQAISVHPDYERTGDRRFDIAVLTLAEDVSLPSTFELRAMDEQTVSGATIRVTGFPMDKGGLSMFEASGRVVAAEGERLFHDIDTWDGQSGAPVWIPGSQPTVIGLHVDGKEHSYHLGKEANLGVLMTPAHVSWIRTLT